MGKVLTLANGRKGKVVERERRKEIRMAKKKKKKEVEKTEEEILFPEVELHGVVFKPWSLGTTAKVAPHVESLIEKLEEKDILSVLLGDMEATWNFAMFMKNAVKFYFVIAVHAAPIISITTGLPIEEVEEFDPNKAIEFVSVIWNQNQDNLKNVLTLFGMSENLTVAEEETDMELAEESKE